MKKRKGFTLVELLAVIVILGIISLITVPVILNVIDETKREAFKNTAYGIVKAAELLFAEDMLTASEEAITFTYINGVESSNPSGRQLNYKGEKPNSGVVILNADGEVAIAIYNGKYCAEKDYSTSAVFISKKTEAECQI